MLIKEVGEAIAHCTPPQVFGIHGDWGLGKTSFLHQVQLYLTDDCPQQSKEARNEAKQKATERGTTIGVHRSTIRAVWFDAWRYQNENAPVVALLQEMRMQLSLLRKATNSVSRRVGVATRGALLSMEELTKNIGFQYSKFRQADREWKTETFATDLPSYTLREHLQQAIGQLLPKRQGHGRSPRLAVFIDDVDRCEPEAAYRLLEGLKIYLTLDNCVFVLGMNQKAVESAIASQMVVPGETPRENMPGESIVMNTRAAAYLEKLCQNVWRLPAVRTPSQVLRDLLEETVTDQSVREWIGRAVETSPCLPPNPRRIKGLSNLIGRLSSRLEIQEGPEQDKLAIREAQHLLIVAYVYQFHHDIYVRWEADPNLYNAVYERCRGNQQYEFLNSLVMPKQEITDPKAPTQQGELATTYPDPTDSNVFWIQPLILHLGTEVDPTQFQLYLHGVRP